MHLRSLSILGLCFALALAACGEDEQTAKAPRLPGALAEHLASQSELVASSLDAGKECLADAQAAIFKSSVESAIAGGGVPPPLQPQLKLSADRLASDVKCEQPAPEPTAVPTTTTEDKPAPPPDCDAIEEQLRQLEEQRKDQEKAVKQDKDAAERLKQQFEQQKQALEEQRQAACEEGGGGEDLGGGDEGPGNSENAPGHGSGRGNGGD
jgi:hypothetical protein